MKLEWLPTVIIFIPRGKTENPLDWRLE